MRPSLPRRFPSYRSEDSPFLLDLRAVGLFRVLLALIILLDQIVRLCDWHAFHGVSGVVSLADSRAWDSPWVWSLHWLSDAPILPYVLEAARLLATLALLLGIRPRLSAFVLFVLLASVATRNPLPLQGGDKVLVVMTFFAVFLPLGQWGSLERLWFGASAATSHRSPATVAYAVQILLVWFMAGIMKTGEQWWSSGTAVSMALHLEAFATEFARLWRHWDWFLQPLTLFIFVLECLAPLLALVPRYWCRIVGLLALVALEVGIWLSLEVGLFPLISLISLVPLFPGRFIDFLARLRPGKRRLSDLVLFYDRDCRFCVFACRLLLAACGIRGARLREAQSEPEAARILDESFAWSVARARPAGEADGAAAPDPGLRQGWEAVRYLVEHSPRAWLLRVLPGGATGDRLYAWIGRNRGGFGRAGALCFGRNGTAGWPGPVGHFVAAFALATVLLWNVVSYPAVRDTADLRPLVSPLISALNLKQFWSMFAPYPYYMDMWHVMPALARDGSRLDLLSGAPVSLEPPRDGPARYGGYRWRKTVWRSQGRGEIDRVTDYHCRTGAWSAMELWEFRRPNLGVAATADLPYQAVRLGRWQCADADADAVSDFHADVDALMKSRGQPGAPARFAAHN